MADPTAYTFHSDARGETPLKLGYFARVTDADLPGHHPARQNFAEHSTFSGRTRCSAHS